jgi:hypothetical protein
MNMKDVLLLFALLLATGNIFGQTITEYLPLEYSKDSIPLNEKAFKASLNIQGLKDLPKGAREEILDFYYERQSDFLHDVRKHHFILDKAFTNYLQNIFDEIVRANNLKDQFKLHIARYTTPNAVNTGDGNIIFYLGLLKKMKNEAQIAFILCHEISHQLLNHVNQGFMDVVKTRYSDTFKKELKQIEKTEYGAGEKYVDFVKKTYYDKTKHTRASEASADSMGLLLLINTPYDAYESLSAMNILDSIEVDTFKVDYERYFTSREHPFNKTWIAKTKSIAFGGKDAFNINLDSIKTHPDCKKRLEVLKGYLEAKKYDASAKKKFIQPKASLDDLVKRSKFEEIQYLYDFEHYGVLLYYALNLLDEYPDDVMIYNRVSQSLAKMTEAMEKHKLHDYVVKPSPAFSEYLNQILRLLDQVSIADLKNLNSNFLNMVKERFYAKNETFKSLYNKNSLIPNY